MPTPSLPSRLSQANFRKLLGGKKTYAPQKLLKHLKDGGFRRELGQPSVSKQEALKILKKLREEKLSPRPLRPEQLYHEAAKKQFEIEKAKADEIKRKHIQTNIRIDAEEADAELENLGKSILDLPGNKTDTEIKRIDAAKHRRDEIAKRQEQQRDKFFKPKGIEAEKPKLADPPDLPIDFGR